MTDLTPIAGKLSNLVRLLASDKDGEVIAAARALNRCLKSAGADMHVFADRIGHANGGKLSETEMRKLYDAGFAEGIRVAEDRQHGNEDFCNTDGTPVWHEVAKFCQRNRDRISTREQEFIDSVSAHTVYREPTEKQAKWLKAIFLRLGGKLA